MVAVRGCGHTQDSQDMELPYLTACKMCKNNIITLVNRVPFTCHACNTDEREPTLRQHSASINRSHLCIVIDHSLGVDPVFTASFTYNCHIKGKEDIRIHLHRIIST